MASNSGDKKPSHSGNQRKSRRDSVEIRAEILVSAGPRFMASVIDLSRNGFRIETGNLIPIQTKVYLNMPGMHSLQARVAWHDQLHYGCEFTQPLHETVFEHIAQRHPLLVC